MVSPVDIASPSNPRQTHLLIIRGLLFLLLATVVPALIAAWAYRQAVTFAFMYDDPLDLPRGLSHSVFELLTSSGTYSYYRPLSFLIWKGMHTLLGHFDRFWFHALPVGAHSCNAALVAWMASRLGGRFAGVAAGVVFALYPFSYQAVFWAGALFHPLVTLCILLAIIAFAHYQVTPRWWVACASLTFTITALLSHEEGIAAAPLICCFEICFPTSKPAEASRLGANFRRWALPLAHVIVVLIYLALYRLIPKSHAPLSIDFNSLRLNGLYLLQGVGFWAIHLVAPCCKDAMHTVLVGGTLALLGLVVVHALHRSWRLACFACGWILIAWAPQWASLPFTYVIDAPRLLYLASVGIAMLWGGLVGPWCVQRPVSIGIGLVGALVIAAVSVQSYDQLRAKAALFAIATSHLDSIARVEASTGAAGTLLVNPISWLAPDVPDYPLGHDGVTLVPSYIGLNQVEAVALGSSYPVHWTGYDVVRTQWHLTYGELGGNASLEQLDEQIRGSAATYLTSFNDQLALDRAGSITSSPEATDGHVVATFGDQVKLRQAVVEMGGATAHVTLYWSCVRADAADVTVFVHLYDGNGRLVAQGDGYPIRGLSAIRLWRRGDVVEDNRELSLSAHLGRDTYSIGVGLYQRATGRRLAAVDDNGVRLRNDTAVVYEFVEPSDTRHAGA
jgi:hypothetical protein